MISLMLPALEGRLQVSAVLVILAEHLLIFLNCESVRSILLLARRWW